MENLDWVKHLLLRCFLRNMTMTRVNFNVYELRNQKQVRETWTEINGNMNVLSFMVSKKRSMGIIMDEIDGMSSTIKVG